MTGVIQRRRYKTDRVTRIKATNRRRLLRDANRCINGPEVGQVGRKGVIHGPVVRGGKCQHCVDVANNGTTAHRAERN